MEASKKLNIDLPYDPAIPLVGFTQRNETQVITNHLHTMFIATILTIAKLWK
jgi:hypothetical protein